jgi:MinD superfamily P-loop ATPase
VRIAVLSGKGGTGKTLVSASLAAASGGQCRYVDFDVEEPNGALFLHPAIASSVPVIVPVPLIDTGKCDGCGECAAACRFHALATVNGRMLAFPELCHHCGACAAACPEGAISEACREIGMVEADSEGLFLQGRLNIGEPMATPVIRELKKRMPGGIPSILDCAPGASCAVMHTVEGCNYCILVTEPTPFGLHDLDIAAGLVGHLGIPCGVVVNKATEGDTSVRDFCGGRNIPLLMEIPFSREIAEGYSRGLLPAQACGEWRGKFRNLLRTALNGGRP